MQMECRFVDEVTPSLTNMGELAPQKSEVPKLLIIQSIEVEYGEEYIIVEPMDSRIHYCLRLYIKLYIVSSQGCWRRQI